MKLNDPVVELIKLECDLSREEINTISVNENMTKIKRIIFKQTP